VMKDLPAFLFFAGSVLTSTNASSHSMSADFERVGIVESLPKGPFVAAALIKLPPSFLEVFLDFNISTRFATYSCLSCLLSNRNGYVT
jgi:hypothetical protein